MFLKRITNNMVEEPESLKENVAPRPALALRWVLAALAATGAALGVAAWADAALPAPAPHGHPPHLFRAANAHHLLRNLTALGPRVSGSYENEVGAVRVVVEALQRVARGAAPHQRLELDVHVADGAFDIAFLDGMNNVYRGVSSVVARLSAAGGRPRPTPARSALLLNCHFDTVPDSPGASDDGAGCAVLVETLRALAAGDALRHDAVFLFNGAEETIMQASHAFITQHKWARSVRAFLNIEACGAGGREMLFQAGPEDPWLLEAYAAAAPHPFGSSLAQELFQSGLLPADTDFRVFRDFGRLSGVDLAWTAGGHVYHTRLDTADRVPLAALQRTGDNVLALARGLLGGSQLASAATGGAAPVYFDVLGLWLVTARAGTALALAAAALALVALDLHVTARRAQRELFVPYGWWWRAVTLAAGAVVAASGAGVAAAAGVAALLAAAGARLSFYSRGWLLVPLYAFPALAAQWAALAALVPARAALRGWWRARAVHGACAALGAGALGACVALGVRSGFVPLAWCAGAAAAELACGARGAGRAACWALGAAPALLLTAALALAALRVLVPVAGRAGASALPADVWVSVVASSLALATCSWVLPLAVAARPARLVCALAAGAAAGALLAALAHPYSEEAPQRLMVLHARRTEHGPRGERTVRHEYWVPHLDDNTPRTLREHGGALRAAAALPAAECASRVLCGAPYFLPGASLVARWHRGPADTAPRARLAASVRHAPLNGTRHEVVVRVARAPRLVVAAVAPAAGARLAWSSVLAAPRAGAARWGARDVYFFALHAARGDTSWELRLHLEHSPGAAPREWAAVSLAGHALAAERAPPHAALLAALPPWVAATGWGVDLHLYSV